MRGNQIKDSIGNRGDRIGTQDADRIRMRDGDDRVDARDGNDLVNGSDGRDSLRGGNGDDAIFAGSADDLLSGGFGDDTVLGGGGDDVMGNTREDLIDWTWRGLPGGGATGRDTWDGGAGSDTIYASVGDVVYSGGNADVIVLFTSFAEAPNLWLDPDAPLVRVADLAKGDRVQISGYAPDAVDARLAGFDATGAAIMEFFVIADGAVIGQALFENAANPVLDADRIFFA